jgi:CDP-diacylglycerol--glycerol-3-phosphate 3-phosphatidyltransferase
VTALSQPAAETGGGARPAPPAAQGGIPQPGVMNVANALTMLRLVLVPVFVLLLLAGGTGWRIAAFAVFLIASVTDLLDGRIARQRGLITDFGKIADPIADKALTGAALVTLSAQGALAWWVTCVILVREVAVTGLRFWVIHRGVIAASRGGKVKTLLQVIAIALFVLPGPPGVLRDAVMAAAVAVTLATGVDYGARAVRLRRRPMPSQPAGPPPAGPPPAGPPPGAPQPGSSVGPAGEAP